MIPYGAPVRGEPLEDRWLYWGRWSVNGTVGREVRDMALGDMEHELSLADAELRALKQEVQHFVRNPVDALLPAVIGPLLSGAAKGIKARKSK